MTEKVQSATTGGNGTDYGDQYFRTNPRFETGDPRYAWLNQTLFVAPKAASGLAPRSSTRSTA